MVYVSNTGDTQIISLPRSFHRQNGLRYHLKISQADKAIYATNLTDLGGSWLYYNFKIDLPEEMASGEYEYPMLIGLVTKTTVLSGDADGDGAISSTDVIVLARYVASWNGYADLINLANADVYADGVVDTQDVIVLARHIANWNGYKTLPVQPNA